MTLSRAKQKEEAVVQPYPARYTAIPGKASTVRDKMRKCYVYGEHTLVERSQFGRHSEVHGCSELGKEIDLDTDGVQPHDNSV